MYHLQGHPRVQAASTSGRQHVQYSGGKGRGGARRQAPVCATAVQEAPSVQRPLNERLRDDFPILHQRVHDKPLIYFDNGATSQTPRSVTAAVSEYYDRYNSNVHRGVHSLASLATAAYEDARVKVARFINAASSREVIYTKGATEGINLVAHSWGTQNLQAGDEILLSVAEHHSNLVPWQLVAQRTGARLRFIPLTRDTQELDMQAFHDLLNERTKMVAVVHVSNMLGGITPVAQISEAAHKVGARVLLDACQSVPHMETDVQALGADFVVFSAHKMCGTTGMGVLWGRGEVLEGMPPFLGGGEMIEHVDLERSTYALPPSRFEAGTPPIAEAIGLGAAVDYLEGVGMANVHKLEDELGGYLYERLCGVEGVTLYGPPPARGRAALASFNAAGLHATDISTMLDFNGIAVRSGHHCTQPLHKELGIPASVRASLYLYNTAAEIDTFIEELKSAVQFFKE